MSSAFDRNTAMSLIIVRGFNEEDIQTFHDFCEAAGDKFHVRAHVAQFANGDDVDEVRDWLEFAKECSEESE
jgi:hypothetical protein